MVLCLCVNFNIAVVVLQILQLEVVAHFGILPLDSQHANLKSIYTSIAFVCFSLNLRNFLSICVVLLN